MTRIMIKTDSCLIEYKPPNSVGEKITLRPKKPGHSILPMAHLPNRERIP